MLAAIDERRRDLDRLRDRVAQIDLLRLQHDLAAAHLGHVEESVDEVHHVIDLALDHRVLARERGIAAQLDQLERGHDRRERVAQLVAEHRQELVLAPVRFLGGEPARTLLLAADPIREIARDLREPDQLTRGVADRADNGVRPEPRAVRADAPALVLEPAGLTRDLELVIALPRRDVVRRIEPREVHAEDLVRGVAHDRARARVPRGHVALRIEHDQRVVADAVDQQPDALLGLDQGLLREPALAQVARDLRESHERAAIVAHRRDRAARPEPRAILADAPTLFFEPTLARRDLELVFALAVIDIGLRIEPREVRADDLGARVAVDPLCSRVPGRDPARGIEHEDRVVTHARDEQPEQALRIVGQQILCALHGLQAWSIALPRRVARKRAHRFMAMVSASQRRAPHTSPNRRPRIAAREALRDLDPFERQQSLLVDAYIRRL